MNNANSVRISAAKRGKNTAQGVSLGWASITTKPRRGERNVAYTVPKLKDFSPEALDKAAAALLSALEKESSSLGDDGQRKAFRDRWLARKDGILTQINDLWLKPAPKDAKREVGQRVNESKAVVEQAVRHAQDIQLHF